ncbi:MAG: putative DNA-binding domain-containing protein [Arenimonas sp.]|nr:putative DNA-binding domain-containing protein [Arenimonas sp.]
MSTAPDSLYQFQRALSGYLRDPKQVARPQGIPSRPAKIYEQLLFNNICGFVDACFPVAKKMQSERRWRSFCRSFFRDWQSHTPYFSKIPEQFVKYMQANSLALGLPAYLPELLYYEWLELEVETAEGVYNAHASSRIMALNPSVRYARFQWPVHQISQSYRPRKPVPTVLLVYRNAEDSVKFVEINEITAQLLDVLNSGAMTSAVALKYLAKQLGYASPEPLLVHGNALMADLLKQEILQGKLT